ncbi:MAG: MarR family transcriptional regulator [Candidatus Sumerlaeota bacterium]|nr:MarR family transcriptional regulator [Candidatus Sumerlaeota bacterium]
MMQTFLERYKEKIAGVLSFFDRVIVTGTLPDICYAQGMSFFLKHLDIRIFDYTKWAAPLREKMRENAEKLASESKVPIQFLRRSNQDKEEIVAKIVKERGEAPGLVAILSAMERCQSYEPWHDKKTHETFLRYDEGKCLHYYFYFILEDWGLCYLRVPTWAPFRLQFYFNGHNALAAILRKHGIGFKLADKAFIEVEDWDKAQRLAESLRPEALHRLLDKLARTYCPVIRQFPQGYHWSLMQVEYSTDVVFRKQSDLAPLYEELSRTVIHAVKPDKAATFLGRKLNGNFAGETGNRFSTRIEGTCIRHTMDSASIKMYDKFHLVLRIETTVNDVSFFKHYRQVEHRDGSDDLKVAPVKKSIYSLPILRQLMGACNERYLEFLGAIEDPSVSHKELDKISRPVHDGQRSARGFNFFHGGDAEILHTLLRGEFAISGFRNQDLRRHFAHRSSHEISRLLKRLRIHGMIKKICNTRKFYLTKFGRRMGVMALKIKEMFMIPVLRGLAACES